VVVIGEIEEFPVRADTRELEAGGYVLLCNLVEEEDGKLEAPFAEGMRTPFTVE
jgi:hypothetical protein